MTLAEPWRARPSRVLARALGLRAGGMLADFLAYGLVSAFALGCDCSLLWLLVKRGEGYMPAAAASFAAGMCVAYALSVTLVFSDRRHRSRAVEMATFFTVGIAGLLLTQALLYLFVGRFGASIAWAKSSTAAVVFVFNFVSRRSLAFGGNRLACWLDAAAPEAGRGARTLVASLRRRASTAQAGLDFCAGAGLAFAWFLSQANEGLRGDARIYIGRALADVDPGGVGHDLMFVHDGQSAFTIFGALARTLVATVGLDRTATLLTLANVVIWALAIWNFARIARPGRAILVILAAALLLPRPYTPWGIMNAGEALAIPRPLAEACVLLALTLLMQGRVVLCLLPLIGAAVIHPIMALPGFGVLLLVLCRSRLRWIAALAAVGVVLALAGALGAPVLSRLFVRIDPIWLGILHVRNSYLFIGSWPSAALATAALQMATILLASCLFENPLRLILRAIVVTALLACGASYLFCDCIPLLLVAQIQPWRALWLCAAVAPCAAGFCLWRLPDLGNRGRASLALLAAGWATTGLAPLSALFATLALVLHMASGLAVERRLLLAIYATAGAVSTLSIGADLALFAQFLAVKPAELATPLIFIWAFTGPALAISAFAFCYGRLPRAAALRALALALAPLGLWLVVTHWDDRTPVKADVDAGHIKPDLVALLASRPGEVLWLGGDELWYWTRRPNWNEALQGAGLVFSRELALSWKARTLSVVEHGLAPEDLLDPWKPNVARPVIDFDRARIDELCRRPDAPAWVVTPLPAQAEAPTDPDVVVWTSPFDERRVLVDKGKFTVHSSKRRAIVPCARNVPRVAPATAPARPRPAAAGTGWPRPGWPRPPRA